MVKAHVSIRHHRMNWVSHGIYCWLLKSVLVRLLVHVSISSFASAMLVSVNITSHKITDHVIPDELNITLLTDGGTQAHLCLKRVDHIDPNIPVYTHSVGTGGIPVYKREHLEHKQNIGYYQDTSNGAVIQATRTNDLGEKDVHLVLTGELNIAGRRYTLTSRARKKRNAVPLSPQSAYEEYNLLLQTSTHINYHDYIEAPPEIKRVFIETTRLEEPSLTPTASSLTRPSLTKSESSPPVWGKWRRRRSLLKENYYVDVVAVADYAIYQRFLTNAGSKTDTLHAVREYYAFIVNGVDLRYQRITSTNYAVHVRLIKVLITETAAAGSFTEKFRVSSRPWDEVDAQAVLAAFSDFVAGSARDLLTPYDHVMLFTGYDLTSTLSNSVNTNATTGLAFTSTLCRTDGKSVSVVEDLGGFQAVDTAAHELGHSLSARHDGDGNLCRSSDRYIMASGSSQVTPSNRFNPWLFSPCSVASFTSFFSSVLTTARGQACLMMSLTVSSGIPDVSSRLPGQELPPDDQCRMIYGSASRLCRGSEFGASSSVCTSMFCFDPNTIGTCYEQTAAMGTTCGNGKLCVNGQCVYDSRAPYADEDCVFGDQPGNAFDEMTCPDFVGNFTGYCYQAVVRGRCCTSCRKVYKTVTACEYGDKVRGCVAKICSFAALSYLEQCCGTCNYGIHFTSSPNIPQASNANSYGNHLVGGQTTTLDNQTTILPTILHTDPDLCEDSPNILINGYTCPEAVSSNPKFCYETEIRTACCSSCGQVNTGVPGTDKGEEDNEDSIKSTENVEVEEEVIAGEDEQDEEKEKQNENYQQEDETVKKEGKANTDDKEDEELANDEMLEEGGASKNRNSEEIMAKTDLVLSIHINLGCEYGDKIPSSCSQAQSCVSGSTNCCKTCSTTVGLANFTVTTPVTSVSALACTDQHSVIINNMTCAEAIGQSPFYCYADQVSQNCCFSCQQRHSGIKGCEYGDRTPQKCKSKLTPKECQRISHDCCSTCFSHTQKHVCTVLIPFLTMSFTHLLVSVLLGKSSLLL